MSLKNQQDFVLDLTKNMGEAFKHLSQMCEDFVTRINEQNFMKKIKNRINRKMKEKYSLKNRAIEIDNEQTSQVYDIDCFSKQNDEKRSLTNVQTKNFKQWFNRQREKIIIQSQMNNVDDEMYESPSENDIREHLIQKWRALTSKKEAKRRKVQEKRNYYAIDSPIMVERDNRIDLEKIDNKIQIHRTRSFDTSEEPQNDVININGMYSHAEKTFEQFNMTQQRKSLKQGQNSFKEKFQRLLSKSKVNTSSESTQKIRLQGREQDSKSQTIKKISISEIPFSQPQRQLKSINQPFSSQLLSTENQKDIFSSVRPVISFVNKKGKLVQKNDWEGKTKVKDYSKVNETKYSKQNEFKNFNDNQRVENQAWDLDQKDCNNEEQSQFDQLFSNNDLSKANLMRNANSSSFAPNSSQKPHEKLPRTHTNRFFSTIGTNNTSNSTRLQELLAKKNNASKTQEKSEWEKMFQSDEFNANRQGNKQNAASLVIDDNKNFVICRNDKLNTGQATKTQIIPMVSTSSSPHTFTSPVDSSPKLSPFKQHLRNRISQLESKYNQSSQINDTHDNSQISHHTNSLAQYSDLTCQQPETIKLEETSKDKYEREQSNFPQHESKSKSHSSQILERLFPNYPKKIHIKPFYNVQESNYLNSYHQRIEQPLKLEQDKPTRLSKGQYLQNKRNESHHPTILELHEQLFSNDEALMFD